MATTLKQMMDRLPAERRERVEDARGTAHRRRNDVGRPPQGTQLTQARLAEMLDIGQDGVSRLEKRSDLLLSTLRAYVRAMGGSLDLVARFPDRPPVLVSGIADMNPVDTASGKKAGRPRRRRQPKS